MAPQPDFDYLERTFGQARGRYLDIGSGAGGGYKAGMACAGYRIRWHAARYSLNRLGGDVIPGYFTPAMRTNMLEACTPSYDCLLIDNVLEHVGDSVEFMEQQAWDLLAKRGIALVAVPPVDWFRVMLWLKL